MARLSLAVLAATALLAPAAALAQPEGPPALPPPYERGRLGLQIQPMTPELREYMHAPREAGVLVVAVEPDAPAAEAGVRVGDVVTRAGDAAVESPRDLMRRVGRVPKGDALELALVRDGKPLTLAVKPAGRPWADAEHWKDWMRGGAQQGFEALERRLERLERRLDELERRLPETKPT